MNQIEQKIEDIFRDVMEWDEDKILDDQMNTESEEDWDSLTTMALVIQLEKNFQIKFEYDEVLDLISLGNIKQIVNKKINVK